jgi:hypothetical protein
MWFSLVFIDRSRYFFLQIAPHLSSRDLADLVPDSLLLRKSWSSENGTRDLCVCKQGLWKLYHRVGPRNRNASVKSSISILKRDVSIYPFCLCFLRWGKFFFIRNNSARESERKSGAVVMNKLCVSRMCSFCFEAMAETTWAVCIAISSWRRDVRKLQNCLARTQVARAACCFLQKANDLCTLCRVDGVCLLRGPCVDNLYWMRTQNRSWSNVASVIQPTCTVKRV